MSSDETEDERVNRWENQDKQEIRRRYRMAALTGILSTGTHAFHENVSRANTVDQVCWLADEMMKRDKEPFA